MPSEWIKTPYPGVRCRVSKTRKTKSGHFDRYFTIRYRLNGVAKEEALGWSSQGWNAEKAFAVLSEIRVGIKTGKGPFTLEEKRLKAISRRSADEQNKSADSIELIPLEVFFEAYYMPDAKRSKRSWLTDEQRFRKIIQPALGKIPLNFVARDDVQRLLDELGKELAPATVKQYMSLVRKIFNLASKTTINGHRLFVGINPAVGLSLPAVFNARERFLTGEEVARLIAAAKTLRRPDLHDAIVLSLNTGLRLGELIRLSWFDVDLAHDIVTVKDEEMRKPGGKVPLNSEAKAILISRSASRDGTDHRIFPPIFGSNYRNNLSHEFHRLVDALGLNEGVADPRHRIVFHSLRHTFASWLALAGVDIYRIKTLMRHRGISMTMRYAHLMPDATRDAIHNLRPPKATKANPDD